MQTILGFAADAPGAFLARQPAAVVPVELGLCVQVLWR
jgi:hypothetical protein